MNSDIAQLASLAHSQIPLAQSSEYQDDGANGNKRKSDDGQQGPSKSRRSRYISLACNECKRRKIKCNGQSPCQRCGNLNLECVYAANCCNGFKDSQEYKEMSNHIASLQEQVNALYDNINSLRAQLGQSMPTPQAQMQQPQYHQSSSIDPSLQSQSYNPHQAVYQHDSQDQGRPKSQPQSQQSFRELTSADFNFETAKSSLQALGAVDQGAGEGNQAMTALIEEQRQGHGAQLFENVHEDKDPLWSITREEALRLCGVFKAETGVLYPIVDVARAAAYVDKLYTFLEALHRTGLMQQGLPGTDAVDDEDTNILKLMLAIALIIEGGGQSELGTKLFERVQPAIDNSLLGNVNVKGIRLLIMAAIYELERDNEGTAWRLIGLASRLCLELGLHRRETYDHISDQAERSETILLFWSCYVLDRRWSLGNGMSSALHEADLDLTLPLPRDLSPYLTAMVSLGDIGSKIWKSMAAETRRADGGIPQVSREEMFELKEEVDEWQRSLPSQLQYHPPSKDDDADLGQSLEKSPKSRSLLVAKMLLFLRANNMRILILRPVLHSAAIIDPHPFEASMAIMIAKANIREIANINRLTDLFQKKQVLFRPYLTSGMAVLFLGISHVPEKLAFPEPQYNMAVDLIRGLKIGSHDSQRLERAVKTLQDIAPELGKPYETTQGTGGDHKTDRSINRPSSMEEVDLSRSAAVAMAGLAGHNVDEMAVFNRENLNKSAGATTSSHPEETANALEHMYEVASKHLPKTERVPQSWEGGSGEWDHGPTLAVLVGQDRLFNVLKDLF